MAEWRRGGDENSGPLQWTPAELSGCGLQVLSTPQPQVESHQLQLVLKREEEQQSPELSVTATNNSPWPVGRGESAQQPPSLPSQ